LLDYVHHLCSVWDHTSSEKVVCQDNNDRQHVLVILSYSSTRQVCKNPSSHLPQDGIMVSQKFQHHQILALSSSYKFIGLCHQSISYECQPRIVSPVFYKEQALCLILQGNMCIGHQPKGQSLPYSAGTMCSAFQPFSILLRARPLTKSRGPASTSQALLGYDCEWRLL
jgi:hypothetical protein